MAITTIKTVINNLDYPATLIDMESSETVEAEPHYGYGADMWVPWAGSTQDFANGHYMSISVPGMRWQGAIWQQDVLDDGDFVRVSPGFYAENGAHIGGVAVVGGERVLVIDRERGEISGPTPPISLSFFHAGNAAMLERLQERVMRGRLMANGKRGGGAEVTTT